MPQPIEYPYEIESNEGGKWVFTADDTGEHSIAPGETEPAAVPCSRMVAFIESGRFPWLPGSCVYHGPLRKETDDAN
jgi:hypothetical protein